MLISIIFFSQQSHLAFCFSRCGNRVLTEVRARIQTRMVDANRRENILHTVCHEQKQNESITNDRWAMSIL